MSKEVTMRYRMSDRDVFYGGGVVNGARSITYMGDVADRLMAKLYGNVSRCCKVRKIRLFVPCHAGDYMEFKARLNEEVDGKAVIEVRSFKVYGSRSATFNSCNFRVRNSAEIITRGAF